MLTRFRRYIDNVGLGWFLANAAVLAYLLYLHLSIALSSSTGAAIEIVIVLPLTLVGLFGPRLILGFLVARPAGSMRVARVLSYAIVAWVVIRMTTNAVFPMYVFPLLVLAIFLSFELSFWVISDPRVFTERGINKVIDRAR